MIPHIQTNTSKVTGNCWQTAVACVLDLEPEQVPHFVGAEVAGIVDDWWIYSYTWMFHHNLNLINLERHLYTGEYYLVMGKTIRGTYHVCVYQNGKIVHDPHPDASGLTHEEGFVVIRNH